MAESLSSSDFEAKMREEYMFENMVKRFNEKQQRRLDRDRDEGSIIGRAIGNIYEELEKLSWNYKQLFHLPTDFDKKKHAISFDFGPDYMTDMYLEVSDKTTIGLNFSIEYKDDALVLWVNYEYGGDQDYQYISPSWEKIVEAIIAHSKIGCDRVRFTMSIYEQTNSDEIQSNRVEFSELEVPFHLYKALIHSYLRRAYATEEEKKAYFNQRLESLRAKIGKSKKERIVVRL